MKLLKKLLVMTAMPMALFADAENVSQKQAAGIAATFFNAAYGEHVAAPKLHWNGRQLTTNRLFAPFYVYNHPKGGFVIISADSKAFPVLGYGLKGRFDKDKLGADEKKLLTQYAREIELIRYDSRTPDRAIEAWQKMPQAIYAFLNNPYSTPEFEALTDEQQEFIELIDRRNGWIMIPSAVEFPVYDPERFRDYVLEDVLGNEMEAEDVPFEFYNSFISELEEEERMKAAALEELINPTRPVVKYLGGAHYSISFPENVRMVRVYGMEGTWKLERYSEGTPLLSLDLSSLGSGFYAVMVLTEGGKVYGLKLSR
ncbi:MAG: Spi family protease inhibitor [Muribaculaceae bacterium]|nr:Spi family protease inhibitor [Muribaculaceae bacterium]